MKLHHLLKIAMTTLWCLSFSGTTNGFYGRDPEYLFTDDELNRLYGQIEFFDTTESRKIPLSLVDSGSSSYDGSPFIKFNYQFSDTAILDSARDSVLHFQISNSPWDSAKLLEEYEDNYVFRPGFAGFRMLWDNGMDGFRLLWYKYLILAHHGPLPNHKVTVLGKWSVGNNLDAITGATRGIDTLGTFGSSDIWKAETLLIPAKLRNLPDSVKTLRAYYQLNVLINNLVSNDTASSPPGYLAIDNICISDTTRIITDKTPTPEKKGGCGAGWGLAILPPLIFRTLAPGKRKKRG